MVIYKITNTVNDKVYVGQCKGVLKRRFLHHMSEKEDCTNKFYLAIQEIKPENFSIEIIDRAESHDQLNELEIYWIDKLNSIENGYNTTKGGNVHVRRRLREAKVIENQYEGKFINDDPRGRKKKENRREIATPVCISISNNNKAYLIKKYGSLNAAIKTLLPNDKPDTIENVIEARIVKRVAQIVASKPKQPRFNLAAELAKYKTT